MVATVLTMIYASVPMSATQYFVSAGYGSGTVTTLSGRGLGMDAGRRKRVCTASSFPLGCVT